MCVSNIVVVCRRSENEKSTEINSTRIFKSCESSALSSVACWCAHSFASDFNTTFIFAHLNCFDAKLANEAASRLLSFAFWMQKIFCTISYSDDHKRRTLTRVGIGNFEQNKNHFALCLSSSEEIFQFFFFYYFFRLIVWPVRCEAIILFFMF